MLLEIFPGQGGKSYSSKTPEQDLLIETIGNYKRIKGLGVKSKVLLGNSYGLYAVMVAAGVVSMAVALDLARRRAELVERAEEDRAQKGQEKTGMLSILGKDINFVRSLVEKHGGLDLTNYNGPFAHVLSGPRDLLGRIVSEVGAARTRLLDIEGAYHSSYRQQDSEEYGKAIERFDLKDPDPNLVVISSTDPRVLKTARDFRDELVHQMIRPVYLSRAIQVAREAGVSSAIDIGPTDSLQKLVRRIDPELPVLAVETQEDSIRSLVA